MSQSGRINQDVKEVKSEMYDRYIKQVKIDWSRVDEESYVRDIPSLSQLNQLTFNHNITFFVGENGSGKSTLIEAIAVAYGFSAEGGTRNYNFSTYESHSDLYEAISFIRGIKRPKNSYFLRAESFYNVATKTEDYRDQASEVYYAKYGGKSFHEQSHGESFLSLLQGQFLGQGIYILDEPEAALSPQRQLTLLIEIDRLAKIGSQFIIATHSPILLGLPGASILSFDNGEIQPCDYTQTSAYQITEMFINNRDYFLSHLLSEDI